MKIQAPKNVTDFNTETGGNGRIVRYNITHAANTANAPLTDQITIANLEVFNWADFFYKQRYFQINNAAQFERVGVGNPVTWKNWVKIQTVDV